MVTGEEVRILETEDEETRCSQCHNKLNCFNHCNFCTEQWLIENGDRI